jgi:hypothetical protein
MAGTSISLDPKSLSKVLKRLNDIEKNLTPAPRTPLGDLMNITALDITREAKLRSPVDTGRLRSSIHPKMKPSDSFSYSDNTGKTFTGGLKEPVEQGKEVVVGTNVEYAMKQEIAKSFLHGGVIAATPALKRRLKQLAAKVVGGKPNINIT